MLNLDFGRTVFALASARFHNTRDTWDFLDNSSSIINHMFNTEQIFVSKQSSTLRIRRR
jgi:hypothetical protein